MENAINMLVTRAHTNAVKKGFHENELNIPTCLCLIHSEVSEAMEADRKGREVDPELQKDNYIKKILSLNIDDPDENEDFEHEFISHFKDTLPDELADVVIRVFDLSGAKGIDLESHILAKMRYNESRPIKHGNNKY